MATTYTTNYHLGKQTDHADKFDMKVITDDMDVIDTQMKANADAAAAVTPSLSSSTISDTTLEAVFSGTVAGALDPEITGGSGVIYGIVRAYKVNDTDAMQIAETVTGLRKTRYYTSAAWGSWL